MAEEHGPLGGKIVSGLLWVAWGKGAQAVLQFVVMAVLARLLTPAEFGAVGAAMIVVGFSEIFTKLGLGPALVQRSELEPRHLGTAFSVSMVTSLAIAAIIWVFAPFIAGFFGYDGLIPILRVLALLFPIRGIALVGESLATRELRFRWLSNRDAFCVFVGYVFFGCGLALLGFGYWSLVAASLVVAVIKAVFLLVEYPPRHIRFEGKAFRELLYFGGGQTAARLFNYAALHGDNLVVGRALGLAALGFYGRAYQLMSVQATLFGRVLDDVLFPSMARMQDDQRRLAGAYFRGVGLIAIVMLPVSVVGIILAPEIVAVTFGPQWSEIILPFRILAAGLLLRTSYKMSDSLARATGSVYRRAWRQAVYAAAVIIGAAIGQFWGIAGVAVGVLVALILNFMLMAELSLKILAADWQRLWGAHVTGLILATAAGLITTLVAAFLRHEQMSSVSVLLGTITILFIFGLVLMIYRPKLLVTDEAVWMMDTLMKKMPSALRPRRQIV